MYTHSNQTTVVCISLVRFYTAWKARTFRHRYNTIIMLCYSNIYDFSLQTSSQDFSSCFSIKQSTNIYVNKYYSKYCLKLLPRGMNTSLQLTVVIVLFQDLDYNGAQQLFKISFETLECDCVGVLLAWFSGAFRIAIHPCATVSLAMTALPSVHAYCIYCTRSLRGNPECFVNATVLIFNEQRTCITPCYSCCCWFTLR